MLSDDENRPRPALADSVDSHQAVDGRRPLRIGLVVQSRLGLRSVRDLALWGQSHPDLCISHLILNEDPPDTRHPSATAVGARRRLEQLRFLALRLLIRLEGLALTLTTEHAKQLKQFDLSRIVPNSLVVRPTLSSSGRAWRYSDEDLQRIAALGFDLLVCCTPVRLRGGILTVARFGTLSINYGNDRIGRRGPPGFWEILLRSPTSEFCIQRLSDDPDGGPLLFRGSIRTLVPFLLNQTALRAKAIFHLRRLIERIARSGALPLPEERHIRFGSPYTLPSLGTQAAYIVTCSWHVLRNPVRRFLLGRHEHWGVAYAYGDWKSLVMCRASRLTAPSNHFLADPFVIRENGADYCFVEDFDCRRSRASISAYRLTESGAERLGEAISEPFHMSFPYLFRFGGKLYMCPETCQQREIRLYECVGFPLQWRLAKVLMSNVSAADTVIFPHGGKWWLFTNIDTLNSRDHSSELYIFHADNPLSGEWSPHPRNPVIVDATRARNGGIVCERDSVYRISQTPGFLLYGRGFAVNRICRLDESEFAEERLYEVEPHFSRGLHGTHHLNSNGHVSVFDFSRNETCIRWPWPAPRATGSTASCSSVVTDTVARVTP